MKGLQQLRAKNAEVQDVHFTSLLAASIPPTLILNREDAWSLLKK